MKDIIQFFCKELIFIFGLSVLTYITFNIPIIVKWLITTFGPVIAIILSISIFSIGVYLITASERKKR